ncbi:MAG: branched chain amino acid ABC transporter substrate-binding protein [Alphaproteobacteria bacterium 64-6]|nr:branched-chain amino acid ABC transporter substrate-binding protein [Hyphomicrobium sp.]MBN9263476.1 branched-chain amino acid ABC transporter substrate-binding protein [Hyphomicrobium sp.]OJU23734.1 MAG: branched chain amino acid ABC transporter substrate-binding protein [Alphaproteobacteria bacterium 64-6]
MKKLMWSGVAVAALLAMTGVASAQVKIGVGGPLTGANATFGAQLKRGAEQAAADINAKGGINGQKIELSFGDDRSDPKEGVSVANKFVGDKVRIVLGHFNSGVSIPASEVYAENGVLMISPASTNPRLTERNLWNTFRTCGRDDQQGEVAGKYLLQNFKGKKVAIVHDKTTYGKGLADETKKTINAGGLKEVLYEGVNPGEKDFAALVSKIKVSGADLVYWGGLHTEGGLIVRQMRDQGVKAPLMSGDGIATDEFAAIGGPGVEGTLMTFAPDPQRRPEAAEVVKTFIAANFKPEAYTLYAYATIQVIAAAATQAKSTDPKKIAETIRGGKPFSTVIGSLSFNKKGDITRPDYTMYTWKKVEGDKITYVQN